MKIVHITEAFEGGVIEFLRCLTHSTSDFSHTIIYGRPQFFEKAHKTFPPNVNFIPWPSAHTTIKPAKDVKALYELIKILNILKDSNIIHLHSAKAGILGRVAARVAGFKKIIYAPHGATFLRKDVSALARSFYVTIEKAASIFPAKVVGVSKSEAESYKRIGIKAEYVNNGKFFPLVSEQEKSKDSFIIVTTGRAAKQKHPFIFNKIASAFTDNKQLKFTWIGDGIERQLLASSNITVTGWVEKNEVENFLTTADLYISTALWEGLPYAVLEAMSMRLPLLLSNCPGNSDLVKHGVNGFLYNKPEEAVEFINQYLQNKELLRVHGEASFNMLQSEFSVQQMEQGYRKIYNSL